MKPTEKTDEYETDDYKVRIWGDVTVVRLKHANLTGQLEVNRIGEEIKGDDLARGAQARGDFKHVKHCGSSALGLLIGLNKQMQAAKGKMILSHPENIEELLRISKTGLAVQDCI